MLSQELVDIDDIVPMCSRSTGDSALASYSSATGWFEFLMFCLGEFRPAMFFGATSFHSILPEAISMTSLDFCLELGLQLRRHVLILLKLFISLVDSLFSQLRQYGISPARQTAVIARAHSRTFQVKIV